MNVFVPILSGAVLVWSAYEFQDELFDDDYENSLIDNVTVIGGIAMLSLGVLVWSLTG